MRMDLILLLLRVTYGSLLLFGHGLPKLLAFSEKAALFQDPLGISPQLSMALAIFAEVFCSAGVILGVLTRWAAIPPAIMLSVALFFVHTPGPWAAKELALLYVVPFLCLIIMGGGRLTLDRLFRREVG